MDILLAVLGTFQKKQLKSILKTKGSKTDPKGSLFPLFFYELYKEYNKKSVQVKRMINSDASKRTGEQVIITNY